MPTETFAYHASASQKALWFLEQLVPGTSQHNLAWSVRFDGELNSAILRQSIQTIVDRHESLRTTFTAHNGTAVQVIHAYMPINLPMIDLCQRQPTESWSEIDRYASLVATKSFDLQRGPLIRMYLFKVTNNEHILLLAFHHLIIDGWSMQIFIQELEVIYQSLLKEEVSPLPSLPIQYSDYVSWQHQLLKSEKIKKQLAYWNRQLDGKLPFLSLPTDKPRPAVQNFSGDVEWVTCPQTLTNTLRSLCQRENVTLFMLLLAAFKILLHRYSGQTDLLVGTPVAGRNHYELENLIGLFVNTLILRTSMDATESTRDFLQRIRQVVLTAYAHQDVPIEQIVAQAIRADRDLSYSVLIQTMLVFHNESLPDIALPGLTAVWSELKTRRAQFDLVIVITDYQETLKIALEYSTAIFEPGTISRMLNHFIVLLQSITIDITQPIEQLSMLAESEHRQLLLSAREVRTTAPPEQTLTDLFEVQVTQTPDTIAVSFAGQMCTFAELNARANQLAHYLRERKVGHEVIVAIFLDRSLDMFVGVWGILKAGGTYLPISPDTPQDRLDFMLADSQALLVLTQKILVQRFIHQDIEVVCLDADWPSIVRQPTHNLPKQILTKHAAYVIYTSGSTGTPKCVVVEHHSVVNLREGMLQATYDATEERPLHLSSNASIAFDAFIEQFVMLTYGHTLYLIPESVKRDSEAMVQYLRTNQIDVFDCTPSQLKLLLQANLLEIADHHPKIVLVGGEAIEKGMWDTLAAKPQIRFYNVYGPTECTVNATTCHINYQAKKVSIGQALAGYQTYVLDGNLQPAPIGVPGELYIGGAGVARGYHNRPDLTAVRFVPDPFNDVPGTRLYRTGDVVRLLSNGNLEFLGRIDQQIKLRGFRIELGEIEALLREHPSVEAAVVTVWNDGKTESRLAAYIVTKATPPTHRTLHQYLKGKLPDYMLPTSFTLIPSMPLTTSGKIDRNSLPDPSASQLVNDVVHVPPRDMVEEILLAIWQDVLQTRQIGIYANFFELGGHSLLATQVASRIANALNINLPVRYIFTAPTIAQLSTHVRYYQQRKGDSQPPPLLPNQYPPKLPLSYAQQRLWFIAQLNPREPIYIVSITLRITGQLDVTALQDCFDVLVDRHESLRTMFVSLDGSPQQKIVGYLPLPRQLIDLSSLPPASSKAEVRRLRLAEAQHPFNLSQCPLIRVTILQLADDQYILFLTLHHIITDGWSTGILIREIAELYTASVNGRVHVLPPIPIQYADFAIWQQQWLNGPVIEKLIMFWQNHLANAPALIQLPTQKTRPVVQDTGSDICNFMLSSQVSQRISEICRQESLTEFMFLVAVWQVLLMRYSGQTDIVLGTLSSGRTQQELVQLIGFFVNNLIIRTDLSGNPTFHTLLQRVRNTILDVFTHQDMPFDKLVDVLKPTRDPSFHPFFQVMFIYQNIVLPALSLEGLQIESLRSGNQHTMQTMDLFVSMERNDEQSFAGIIAYNCHLFTREMIMLLVSHFQTLLRSIVADIHQPIWQLLLTEQSPSKVWPDLSVPPDIMCLHQRFEEQAVLIPTAPAIIFRQDVLTYGQVNAQANKLARLLHKRGLQVGMLVGIPYSQTPTFIIAMLAVFKGGGVCVPYDPDWVEGIRGSTFIIKETSLHVDGSAFPKSGLLDWDDLQREAVGEDDTNLGLPLDVNEEAYWHYFPGTPVLVRMTHQHLWQLTLPALPITGYIQSSTLFLSIIGLGFAVHTGTALQMGMVDDPQVTTVIIPPLLLERFVEAAPCSVQNIIILGRPSNVTILRHLSQQYALYFIYGLPHAAIWLHADDFLPFSSERIALGQHACHQLMLLDPYHQPVPIGVSGQVYVPTPLEQEGPDNLQPTDDIGWYRANGSLEFRGRIDQSVILSSIGFQLQEPMDILCQHPSVLEAIVVVSHKPKQHLVAYILLKKESQVTISDLHLYAEKHLPVYMRPTIFAIIEQIPLTIYGTLNVSALPATQQSLDTRVTSSVGEFHSKLDAILARKEVLSTLRAKLSSEKRAQLESRLRGKDQTIKTMPSVTASNVSHVIPLQKKGTKTPIFLFHPSNGNVFCYIDLAPNLGEDQPIYALQSPGLDNTKFRFDTIEDMVKDYSTAIQLIQPRGPYLLGGWSSGGVRAFAVAAQLLQKGENIHLLALLDSWAPIDYNITIQNETSALVTSFAMEMGIPLYKELVAWYQQQEKRELSIEELFKQAIDEGLLQLENYSISQLIHAIRVYKSNRQLIQNYRPTAKPLQLTLFKAADENEEPRTVYTDLGWKQCTQFDVSTHSVPGTHISMLKTPNVQILGQAINQVITQEALK